MTHLVALREEPLDPAEVEGAVSHPGAGAVVSFVGKVRDQNEGRQVTRLEYEAYPTMALGEMRRIVDEISARLSVPVRLAVVHRVGSLEVGDIAVVCAASAPHREQAFDACRELIDAIKLRVPVWKREHGPDGPYWVGWEDARCAGDHHHSHSSRGTSSADSRRTLEGMRVVCVTVSDSRTSAHDLSGDVAERLLAGAGATVERHLVRDDAEAIAALLMQCVASSPEAVLLSGGTGIGPRDVTLEALAGLLERTLDGFGEAFRRLSFDAIGTRALLSRAEAGTMGASLVFAVPGSPAAVELAVGRLVVPLLSHARAMILGGGH